MSLELLAPGLLTTVQDAGRPGWRHAGVGVAGALDGWSLMVANLLVGNAMGAPALEITLAGPALHLHRATTVALCGAAIAAEADGVSLPGWRPVTLPAGATLRLGGCRDGARALLAVAGGIAVDAVLGSASTDLRGGFGGLGGRALRRGDVLAVGEATTPGHCHCPGVGTDRVAIAHWWVDPAPDLDLGRDAVLHVLPGRDATAPADALCAQPWRVSAASDRQGLRLEGAALALADPGERASEPVAPGTVQLPPGGAPIVLLGDAQTHGGYPRIGHVIRTDRPRLAQLRPGDAVHFVACDVATAQALAEAQRHRLARMAIAIDAQRRRDAR